MHFPASPKEDAVSSVIGTILLVALTVVLIGIIGAVLMEFGMAEPAPILGISIESQGNIITVTHLNGAELPQDPIRSSSTAWIKQQSSAGQGILVPGSP